MKTMITVATALFLSVIPVKAESNDYHQLLKKADIVRTFWSPCDLTRLKHDLELTEIDMYVNQGFVLIAKIKLPATDEYGNQIPECQYTFVRKTNLR